MNKKSQYTLHIAFFLVGMAFLAIVYYSRSVTVPIRAQEESPPQTAIVVNLGYFFNKEDAIKAIVESIKEAIKGIDSRGSEEEIFKKFEEQFREIAGAKIREKIRALLPNVGEEEIKRIIKETTDAIIKGQVGSAIKELIKDFINKNISTIDSDIEKILMEEATTFVSRVIDRCQGVINRKINNIVEPIEKPLGSLTECEATLNTLKNQLRQQAIVPLQEASKGVQKTIQSNVTQKMIDLPQEGKVNSFVDFVINVNDILDNMSSQGRDIEKRLKLLDAEITRLLESIQEGFLDESLLDEIAKEIFRELNGIYRDLENFQALASSREHIKNVMNKVNQDTGETPFQTIETNKRLVGSYIKNFSELMKKKFTLLEALRLIKKGCSDENKSVLEVLKKMTQEMGNSNTDPISKPITPSPVDTNPDPFVEPQIPATNQPISDIPPIPPGHEKVKYIAFYDSRTQEGQNAFRSINSKIKEPLIAFLDISQKDFYPSHPDNLKIVEGELVYTWNGEKYYHTRIYRLKSDAPQYSESEKKWKFIADAQRAFSSNKNLFEDIENNFPNYFIPDTSRTAPRLPIN